MVIVPPIDTGNVPSLQPQDTYMEPRPEFGTQSTSRSWDDSPSIDDVLATFFTGLASSAMDAELAAADRVNAFNAEQAEINRLFQQSSAEKAMQFSADQAQKQMDFQERMSNTAYQRAVQDLKAAGLSPLLAYSNFSTSSPGGSSGVGYSSSGAMASGVTSSGSSAAGVKANPSAGKTADISSILNAVTSIVSAGISSISGIAKAFSSGSKSKR